MPLFGQERAFALLTQSGRSSRHVLTVVHPRRGLSGEDDNLMLGLSGDESVSVRCEKAQNGVVNGGWLLKGG